MRSYFGYIRVSTQKQGRGVSLDEQRAAIESFATRHGLNLVDWFVETETAARQGRTQFTKLIASLNRREAAGVIIHKIDRGARNLKDWANLGELIDHGVDVQFAHESLDLRSRGGRLAADIQAVVAADYIRNLRDEVKKGFYGRLKQGVYPLPAPVGYLDRGAGIPKALDPMMAPLVLFAFEHYAAGGIGLIALQDELAMRGLKTVRGHSISVSGLAKMLRNPFYIGIIRIGKTRETFQGAHKPLVSAELFDRVQRTLDGKCAPKAKKHVFRFRLMIRHSDCTRRLTGERRKERFVYYRCHGRTCQGSVLSEPKVDRRVAEETSAILLTEKEMKDLGDVIAMEDTSAEIARARDSETLRLRVAQCDERIARLADALIDGLIDKETYEARKSRALSDRRQLNDQLSECSGESRYLRLYREFGLNNAKLLQYEMLTDDEKRDLLAAMCSDFCLRGKELEISLRSPYREIAELNKSLVGGPRRSDVRTKSLALLEILKQLSAVAANDNATLKRAA